MVGVAVLIAVSLAAEPRVPERTPPTAPDVTAGSVPATGEQVPPPARGVTYVGPFAQAWTEEGRGPRVLLLHAIHAGAGGHEWSALVPLLREHRSVRVPDLLGCGRSDHPDLDYTPQVVLAAVGSLIRAAGPNTHVVASSLTGAYALKAVAHGARVAGLTLITPTGLGNPRPPAGERPWAKAIYSVGRHTPLGDVFTLALGARPSVRWFLGRRAYGSPDNVSEEAVDAYSREVQATNAKHLALAFVTGRLALRIEPDEVREVQPDVIWACGQRFTPNIEADAWIRAGANVTMRGVGMPHVEAPQLVADHLLRDDRGELERPRPWVRAT
ncbi:MAG: alpha/beta hydrolase [Acidimicrobiia bacterium]|nr:MAG: alpha/beta hydrolase [Acidimicrobiia bacterium]